MFRIFRWKYFSNWINRRLSVHHQRQCLVVARPREENHWESEVVTQIPERRYLDTLFVKFPAIYGFIVKSAEQHKLIAFWMLGMTQIPEQTHGPCNSVMVQHGGILLRFSTFPSRIYSNRNIFAAKNFTECNQSFSKRN